MLVNGLLLLVLLLRGNGRLLVLLVLLLRGGGRLLVLLVLLLQGGGRLLVLLLRDLLLVGLGKARGRGVGDYRVAPFPIAASGCAGQPERAAIVDKNGDGAEANEGEHAANHNT